MSVAKMKIQLQKALQGHGNGNGKNIKKVNSMSNNKSMPRVPPAQSLHSYQVPQSD